MELPIQAHCQQILDTVRANRVTIVVGETGSGKTTQLPIFLYRAGLAGGKTIGITEPRRIAATSVARFVAAQLGTELGDQVGYQIRYDRQADFQTAIKFMTDGILLREMQVDPLLSRYSVIMVDEAHERNVNIDFLLGLLKDLLTRRADLKLVIASATIDSAKFSRYFNNAPVIEVSGRTFPVDVLWWHEDVDHRQMPGTIAQAVKEVHNSRRPGDILVFLPGVDDINSTAKEIEELKLAGLLVLTAHGGQAPEEQARIFESARARKVILATNIAETSITVDGVVFVIDSGLIKQTSFHAHYGIQSLDVQAHSQSGCQQRAGRAGRTQAGVCIRLFTEENFRERPQFTEPEIKRVSLAGVVLQMEALGIREVEKFDFIDPPNAATFHEAYETLKALGAIKERNGGGLTKLGVEMSRLPLEPRIARMVLEAEKHGCVREIVTVAAFLSAPNVFVRPRDKQWQADGAHMAFRNIRSDALTYLRIWQEYAASNYDRSWCHEHFLNSRTLWEVKNIRQQLMDVLLRQRIGISSSADEEIILRSYTAGLIHNLLEHNARFSYAGRVRELYEVFIHPGSSVFGRQPRWMVASEIMRTTKDYGRGCSAVDPTWLVDLAPERFSYGEAELLGYDEEANIVKARKPILYQPSTFASDPSSAGELLCDLTVEEATVLQDQKIAEAEAQGLVKLTFKSSLSMFSTKAMYGGRTIRASLISRIHPQDGQTFYCDIHGGAPSYVMDEQMAIPKFRVFDLPPVQVKEPASVQQTQEVTPEMLEQLQARFQG